MANAAAVIASPAPGAAAAEPAGWLMDERDGFISWLRGEFAAANAIIDLLVVHLRGVGDPGEYDHVAAAVLQRRHHWAPVIHMQQFFPVADVAFALQQAGWRRRAQPAQAHGAAASQNAPPPPPSRRPAFSQSHHSHHHHRHGGGHYRPDPARGGGAVASAGSDKDGREAHNHKEGKVLKEMENMVDTKSLWLDSPKIDEGEKNSKLPAVSDGSSKGVPTPVEYSTNEIIDGKTVNFVEGLKVYEGLVNVTETNKILSLVNETKASFRRGGLEAGQTVIIGKRPLKGHGREIVQMGVPIIEGPPDDENQRETRVVAIPGLLHDLFDRLSQQEIIPFKPDYCVIDFFNEVIFFHNCRSLKSALGMIECFFFQGDYTHPHHSPPWYGRPVCTLCLTDCDMVFGRAISGERGDYRGPLKLTLSTGSLLLLEGKSADVAKQAIPCTRKQRILLSFGKSVARKCIPSESAWLTPPLTTPTLWGPSSRPANLPLFVAPAPVSAAAIPFTPNTTTTWVPEATPRPAPPRFPGPGTGVFLPPGSGHPLPHQMMPASQGHGEPNSPQGSSSAYLQNKIAGKEVSNGHLSPKSSPTNKSYTTEEKAECNGSSNGGSSFAEEKSAVGKGQQNGSLKDVGSSKVQPHGQASK
ncbi:uncharacterized protein LOC120690493 isoform X3 [Panicum virgatum]|uniref:uncharacterized protein LOC120690493 isoform X3 n=1 Tax=Panicum virgatum TaxID=38727 RepID=UPI0019D567F3|nr:uncharacterized protein LOC120690493 isoform X3 [Panicum virgatum]